jgi:hypothetical protein
MPGATWIGPTGNRNPGAELAVYGFVFHIQQGSEAGSEAWQKNPASQVSTHFDFPRAGGIRQLVDTADKAWAQAAGNAHWVSGEFEGRTGQPLTLAQHDAAAQVCAWLARIYGVRLRVCADPLSVGSVAQGGLTWHSAGGASWGGHPDCPGAPIISQIAGVADKATHLLGGRSMDETERTARNSDTYLWHLSQDEPTIPGILDNSGNVEPPLANKLHEHLVAIDKTLAQVLAKLAANASAHDIAAELVAQLRP